MKIKIERGSGNVFADIGLPNAEELLVKAQLAAQITRLIQARKLTQQQAAKQLKISQPKLSNLLRGRFHGISEVKMCDCLTLLGQDVQIVVKDRRRRSGIGQFSVAFA